jgi:hypothetical protein
LFVGGEDSPPTDLLAVHVIVIAVDPELSIRVEGLRLPAVLAVPILDTPATGVNAAVVTAATSSPIVHHRSSALTHDVGLLVPGRLVGAGLAVAVDAARSEHISLYPVAQSLPEKRVAVTTYSTILHPILPVRLLRYRA